MVPQSKYSAPLYLGDNVYINPTYFVIKPEYERHNYKRSIKQLNNERNLKENSTKGILSKKAIGNLRNAINWLIHSSTEQQVYSRKQKALFKFKINFITLTIPKQETEQVTNEQFKKCFNTWLTYARKYFYLSNYVWKIEAHKDGRLHIHLTANTFIHHKDLRDSWNRVLQKSGLLENHFSKFGNYNPNSTDVHSVRNVKNLAGYLCAYMIKKTDLDSSFRGRIWGTSRSLSAKIKCKTFIGNDYTKRDYSFVDRPSIRQKSICTKPDALGIKKEIAKLFILKKEDWVKNMEGIIKDTYNERLRQIRDSIKWSPNEYRQIEIDEEKYLYDSKEVKDKIANFKPCETKRTIPKIGSIQYDLQF